MIGGAAGGTGGLGVAKGKRKSAAARGARVSVAALAAAYGFALLCVAGGVLVLVFGAAEPTAGPQTGEAGVVRLGIGMLALGVLAGVLTGYLHASARRPR